MVFWDVTLYSLVDRYQNFGELSYLKMESRFLRNVAACYQIVRTHLKTVIGIIIAERT